MLKISLHLLATLGALGSLAVAHVQAQDTAATPKNNPPFWAKKGAYVYRVSVPDEKNVVPQLEQGLKITSNLLDGSITSILILNGVIGHDHLGICNWDGTWPYWNRVTFRANNDWKTLSDFMVWSRDNANTLVSFHVNLTDVDIGLRDYPETQAFFKKLVDTKSIYRRDWDPKTNKRIDPPYVPQEIDKYISINERNKDPNPIDIFALVNYKNFWNSGLAKEMLDEFYAHLPYPPPLIYSDVFNLSGGNFETGFPDGPLGGSEATQLEGAIKIIEYIRSKGTDLATEGDRPYFGKRAGYVWLHGKGFSEPDYSIISGGSSKFSTYQVVGNPGAFNVSPVASTPAGLTVVKDHYAALLAGQPGTKKVPGLETLHLSFREKANDGFDIMTGGGDPYRGDWADLINNFYLGTIQELFHIGNGSVRTKLEDNATVVHLSKYSLSGTAGDPITVSVADFVTGWTAEGARKLQEVMLTESMVTKVTVPKAGNYAMRITYNAHGHNNQANFNVYVNGELVKEFIALPRNSDDLKWLEASIEAVPLQEGENTITFDCGAIRAEWSDGTVSEWKMPALRKGFTVKKGDVVMAEDFNRMWPDTWSGQKKIYFFSWDGSKRSWMLPAEWRDRKTVSLYPLTPEGRGKAVSLPLADGRISPELLPQVPYVLTE
jgi:hypothetical protein